MSAVLNYQQALRELEGARKKVRESQTATHAFNQAIRSLEYGDNKAAREAFASFIYIWPSKEEIGAIFRDFEMAQLTVAEIWNVIPAADRIGLRPPDRD